MKTAAEIYNDCIDGDSFYIYDYQPMLSELGEIILQKDDEDYQGDSRLIYKDDTRYGFLVFGWGSCSGCDALQACNTIDDVQSLMNDLCYQIKWFDSLVELQEYFKTKDWELDSAWHSKEMKEFIDQVAELS